jgi:hypothetical protein
MRRSRNSLAILSANAKSSSASEISSGLDSSCYSDILWLRESDLDSCDSAH